MTVTHVPGLFCNLCPWTVPPRQSNNELQRTRSAPVTAAAALAAELGVGRTEEGPVIQLVGPGAAGKSTVGTALASRLQLPFLDLDMRFRERAGDISQYLDRHGYQAYARENVEMYRSCLAAADCCGVMALSSGFMTYPERIHPGYHGLRAEIASSPSTFVLLPSLDLELCVAETVRRQVARSFRRSPEREEAVIRERYSIYMALPASKVETMRPVEEVVEEIASCLPPNKELQRRRPAHAMEPRR